MSIMSAITHPSDSLLNTSCKLIYNRQERQVVRYLEKSAGVMLMGISAIVALVELAVKGVFTLIAYPCLSIAERLAKKTGDSESETTIKAMKINLVGTTKSPWHTMLFVKNQIVKGVASVIKNVKARYASGAEA